MRAPLSPNDRTERLVRAVLLLTCSLLFSAIAWAAGAYRLANQNYTLFCILGVLAAAVIVSRLGAKLVMRRIRP